MSSRDRQTPDDAPTNKASRRWQFSLRYLLVAIIPFSACCIWFSLKYGEAERQRACVQWVKQQNGHVTYYHEKPAADGSRPGKVTPPGPAWLRNSLGIDFFDDVYSVVLDNREIVDLSPLTRLHRLRHLGIFIDIGPDVELAPLGQLEQLESITLDYTNIDRRQLEALKARLPNCQVIVGNHARLR